VAEPQVLTVHEAAEALGVSMQRVRQMVHAGQLDARRSSAGWLIPADSVACRAKNVHRGRPAEPQTAWAAINLLAAADELASQEASDDLVSAVPVVADRKLRHRVLRMLAAMPDPAADEAPWRRLLASRGQVRRLWIHPGLLERLTADPKVSHGGLLAAPAGIDGLAGGPHQLELYVGAGDADALIRRYRMRDDPDGEVKLVIVPSSVSAELSPIPNSPVPPLAAVADLLEEDDIRAHHAAIQHLQFSQYALHAAGWIGMTAAASDKKQDGSQEAPNRRGTLQYGSL
jgi:excisionase family DNA binding protein